MIARNVPSYRANSRGVGDRGVLSFFGALAYAELGAMLPATGGQYVYLREAYGPLVAFVCGWTFMLAVLAGGSAWLAVTFSIYAGYFVQLTPWGAKALAVAIDRGAGGRELRGCEGRGVGAAHVHGLEGGGAGDSDRGRFS